MKSMAFLGLFLVAAGLTGSGCGKSELVTQMESMADRMCACEDTKCTDEVVADLEKFDKENSGKKVTKGDNEKIKAALSRATKCLTEVRSKSVPTADQLPKTGADEPVKAEEPTEKVEEKVEEAADKAEEAIEKVEEKVEEAADKLEDSTDKAEEPAGDETP